MIAARGLGRSFPGRALPALDDVTFEIGRREIVALAGRNGSGKTTLLDVLSTLLLPSGGHASIAGADVVRNAGRARAAIGYAMTGPRGLYMRLTVRANLEFFAALHPRLSNPRARIRELADALAMHEYLDLMVHKCSDGMQQHVVVARALLGRPRVLLLDEPTRALDIVARQRLARLIASMVSAGEIDAVLHATHDIDALPDLSTRALVLSAGRLVHDGPADAAAVARVVGGGASA